MQLHLCSTLAVVALAMLSGSALLTADELNNSNVTVAPLQLPLPSHTIFQSEGNTTWFENLAVSPNGDLFITLLSPTASVYRIRDPSSLNRKFDLVYTIESAQGLTGITAIYHDTYIVAASNFSADGQIVPGSNALWEIAVPTKGKPTGKKITDIPESSLLNGLTTVPDAHKRHAPIVLAADSVKGEVWRVNTVTGKYDIAVKVPEMDPTSPTAVGVNGIKIRGLHLYWTKSDTTTINRVAIHPNGTAVAGAVVETVAHIDAAFLDDLSFDRAGNIWVATNFDSKIIRLRPDGGFQVVVGGIGNPSVAGATAAQFGRAPADQGTLYVTTSGGKVVAIETEN